MSVIPFGINNTVPQTTRTRDDAREALGIQRSEKTLLFFGNIAPYKGVEYAVEALSKLMETDPDVCLVIAGAVKGCSSYWAQVEGAIERSGTRNRIIERVGHVPDEEVEIYFKAADLLLLPYNHIFQSGVLFLSYSFGLPVGATDVGSLREEIVEGKTGFVCQPRDPQDLARAIQAYFSSDLFKDLPECSREVYGGLLPK